MKLGAAKLLLFSVANNLQQIRQLFHRIGAQRSVESHLLRAPAHSSMLLVQRIEYLLEALASVARDHHKIEKRLAIRRCPPLCSPLRPARALPLRKLKRLLRQVVQQTKGILDGRKHHANGEGMLPPGLFVKLLRQRQRHVKRDIGGSDDEDVVATDQQQIEREHGGTVMLDNRQMLADRSSESLVHGSINKLSLFLPGLERMLILHRLAHAITIRVDYGKIILAAGDAAQFVKIGGPLCPFRNLIVRRELAQQFPPGKGMSDLFCSWQGNLSLQLSLAMRNNGIRDLIDAALYRPILLAFLLAGPAIAIVPAARVASLAVIVCFGIARAARRASEHQGMRGQVNDIPLTIAFHLQASVQQIQRLLHSLIVPYILNVIWNLLHRKCHRGPVKCLAPVLLLNKPPELLSSLLIALYQEKGRAAVCENRLRRKGFSLCL